MLSPYFIACARSLSKFWPLMNDFFIYTIFWRVLRNSMVNRFLPFQPRFIAEKLRSLVKAVANGLPVIAEQHLTEFLNWTADSLICIRDMSFDSACRKEILPTSFWSLKLPFEKPESTEIFAWFDIARNMFSVLENLTIYPEKLIKVNWARCHFFFKNFFYCSF